MSITFTCPNPKCQKKYTVADEFAGKRATCKACKQVVIVPQPAPAPARDVEAEAAALLGDDPAAPAPAPAEEAGTIDFTCPFCDAQVQVSRSLAGKRTPCTNPECRRIIKVPVPEAKDEPKDWRVKQPRGPSAARRDPQPGFADAWDTGAKTTASRQALEEAGAIPQVREKLTPAQKAKYLAVTAALVGVVGLGLSFTWQQKQLFRQEDALDRVRKYLEQDAKAPKLPRPVVAALHRGVGEYYLRAGDRDRAVRHLNGARSFAVQGGSAAERDLLLADLAVTQADLGGTAEEVRDHIRLKWEDVGQNHLRRSFLSMEASEPRADALRRLSRKLLPRGQVHYVFQLTAAQPDAAPERRVEELAVVGLEVLRAGNRDEAGRIAAQAVQQEASGRPAAGKPAAGPVSPTLLALLVALGSVPQAQALAPEPGGGGADPRVRAGYAEGWATQGKPEQALALARGTDGPADGLHALVGVAAALVEANPEEARKVLAQAAALANQVKEPPPGLLLRLARLAARAGASDVALQVAGLVTDPAFRGRAQLAVLQAELDAAQAPLDDVKADAVDRRSLAGLIAREALARHNARVGSAGSVADAIEKWPEEHDRIFGYLGLALGMQDSGSGP